MQSLISKVGEPNILTKNALQFVAFEKGLIRDRSSGSNLQFIDRMGDKSKLVIALAVLSDESAMGDEQGKNLNKNQRTNTCET